MQNYQIDSRPIQVGPFVLFIFGRFVETVLEAEDGEGGERVVLFFSIIPL